MKCSCSIFLMSSWGYPSLMLLIMFRQAWLRVSSLSSMGWIRYRIPKVEMTIKVSLMIIKLNPVRVRNVGAYCWSMLYHVSRARAISAIRVRYCKISAVEVILLLIFQCWIIFVLFVFSSCSFRMVLVRVWEILMDTSAVADSMVVKIRALIANSLGNMML